MTQLDDLIRGQIAAYGNVRGVTVKQPRTGAQLGHGNIGGMRNRGKPGFPTGYNISQKANSQPDEGFQVQSEPLPEDDDINIAENKWLRGIAAAGALAAASPTAEYKPPPPGMGDVAVAGGKDVPETTDDFVNQASRETGIQPELIRAVVGVESTGDTMAVSHKGAKGMMQLMPATAAEVGVSDPHDPKQNIFGGARYLQMLANRYKGNLVKVIGAYNAGPEGIRGKKLAEWPAETRNYVKKVLHKLPKGFNVVKFNPLTREQYKKFAVSDSQGSALTMREGHGAGVSQFSTDLSGKPNGEPDLEDAERKNLPEDYKDPLGGLTGLIGGTLRRKLKEARATRVAVTGGKFEPFHKGHAAVVRQLAASTPKVIIFTENSDTFSPETIAALIKASLSDIWDKIEMYPSQGDLQTSVQGLAGAQGTTLNAESQVQMSPMPDDEGTFSQRVREALQDDDKDMVRKMLDPRVTTEPTTFEQIYSQLRRELDASGQKSVEVVTDSPTPLNELGGGAMETGAGYTRGGAFGHSAWSGYNPRGNFDDNDEDDDIPNPPKKAAPGAGSEQYQNMTRSPSTRMLNQTYKGVPNDHMPGDFGQHLEDEEDSEQIKHPTDLSEMIVQQFKKLR